MEDIVKEIKKKREFSELPDEIVTRFAEIAKGDVKTARALLRKYFGVFLTNKVVRAKGAYGDILAAHISSKKRTYDSFYELFTEERDFSSIIDLGSGVNGFSYPYLSKIFGKIPYFAIEASGQIVRNTNSFFEKNGFPGEVFSGDLMDVHLVGSVFAKAPGKRLIFLFQVVDALENLERNSSKKFLEYLASRMNSADLLILSLPVESLGGKKKFFVNRKWLLDFLEGFFTTERDFEEFGERFLVLRKK
jgi:hypothetical protein